LDVVPGRTAAITRVQLDDLVVSVVADVISPTMAEVDSPDERNVTLEKGGMADEDQLLVVRSAPAHSLIEQNFAARLGYLNGEASIFFRTEGEAVAVRTPEQPADVDTSSTRVGQEGGDRCPVTGHAFVPVSSPIGKANFVVRFEARDDLSQTGEVRDPIDKERNVVPLGPRNARGPTRVDLGHGVAPFFRG
jgi:hypothetical protein